MKSSFTTILKVLAVCLPVLSFSCTKNVASSNRPLETFDGKIVPQNVLNVYRLYPEDEAKPIKAPLGYKAVYLTHYGRHGSRYVKYEYQYGNVEAALHKAFDCGKLSEVGQALWEDYSAVFPSLNGTMSNLTPLGAEQHRGIARRMAANFPELFCPGAKVEAMATPMPRTELSMDAFCSELGSHFPEVEIDKVPARVQALNPYSAAAGVASEWDLLWNSNDSPSRPSVKALSQTLLDSRAFASRIFNDTSWAEENIDIRTLMSDLYYIAIDMPNTPFPDVNLCKYMTLEEMSALNRVENYLAYCNKGRCEEFGSHGRQWALSSYILEDMVENAVADIADGTYCARLRFGHDGCFMGMYALLGIEPWNCREEDSEKASEIWNSSLTPMACNLQVVVYRNKAGEMLVRVLYNENDFDLPLKKVRGVYYRTEDLLYFCEQKIAQAKSVLEK